MGKAKGPFWVRRYATGPEDAMYRELDETLALVGAKRMVIGHTQVDEGEIRQRCNGKILMIDTIIGKNAYPECWEPNSMAVEGCEGSISFVDILADHLFTVKVPADGTGELHRTEISEVPAQPGDHER